MKNIIFLYGDDNYSIFRRAQEIVQSFIDKHGEHNFEKIYGDEISDFKPIRAGLETFPFIGDKRMILLRDPWNTRKSVWRGQLADFLKEIPETTILLIAETTKPDKREALFKRLIKSAEVNEFPQLKTAVLAKRAVAEIENEEGRIGIVAATELCERVGNDGFRLENEIQKLVLAADGKEITQDLIRKIVPPADPASNIFALTDALGKRDLKKAMAELISLFENGENEFYLLATLVSHFRNLLLISDLIQRNPSQARNASKELKIHPFVANKALSQVRNFSFGELREIYRELADLDFILKSSERNARQELKMFCMRVCV